MRRFFPLFVILAVVFTADVASARRTPESVFGGKILLSAKPFPRSSRSVGAYISKLKQLSASRFMEDKENKRWKIFYAAFFKRPLNDLEITVKFYDITNGGKRMVESYEQYLSERGQQALSGKFKLEQGPGQYETNTRIMLVLENKSKILASKVFTIEGKRKSFSGKVTFTEEETHK